LYHLVPRSRTITRTIFVAIVAAAVIASTKEGGTMKLIAGVPIDALKEAGLSDADIEYTLEMSAKYRKRWEEAELSSLPAELGEQIVERVCSAYQTGILVGIAKARNITKATKKFGFV